MGSECIKYSLCFVFSRDVSLYTKVHKNIKISDYRPVLMHIFSGYQQFTKYVFVKKK